jgi:probable F420-dependent oxidoreductase
MSLAGNQGSVQQWEISVKLGLGLPQRAGVNLRTDVTNVARSAEAAGFDSLWVYERLLYPVEPSTGLYGMPGVPWPAGYEGCADSLAVLAAAAAVTDTIRLGGGLFVAPLHIPIQLAKALATIDGLSGGGRLLAGLGNGWAQDELRAVGAELADRGRSLDETMDVLEAVWGEDPVSYRGRRTVIDRALIQPKPVQKIPVLLGGGNTAAALDRIARRSDGWIPSGYPPAAVAAMWAQIRQKATEYGRDASAMQLIYLTHFTITEGTADADRQPFAGSMEQILADLAAISAAGADEVIIQMQLQDDFAGATWLLDSAIEIKEHARAAGI